MNITKGIYQADEQGLVHIALPTGKPGCRVEVLVVWDEANDEQDEANEDWSDLFGLLKDTPIERAPQGEFEKRDEFR